MVDVVTLGESLGLVQPTPQESVELAVSLRLGIGGAESNVAIGVSRLGASAEWLGRIGDDDVGKRIRRELRAEGVRVTAIVDDGAPTALMLKEHHPVGPSRVRYYRAGSAGSRLAPDDLPGDWLAGAGLLHLTGITPSLSPSADAAVQRALDLAEAAGVPVSFDVNHRATLRRHCDAAELYRSIARRARVVFAGDDEARLLVPGAHDEDELLDGMRDLGAREAVLKLGERGCRALIDGGRHALPATPVAVVDTVGAGDAFVAGYLAERARGSSPQTRLETAVLCGAFACTSPGDWEGAARRHDLRSLAAGSDPVIR